MRDLLLSICASLALLGFRPLLSQEIGLELEYDFALPSTGGSWAIALSPNGDIVTALADQHMLFYTMNPNDEWASYDYSVVIYSIGVDDNGLFLLCKGNHIEKIHLPSGARSEAVVYWPNINESDMIGYYWETNTYYRGCCYPAPPERTTDMVVEGHCVGSMYRRGMPAPSNWDSDKFAWVSPLGAFERSWETPMHYLFDVTTSPISLWHVDWEHTDANGWRYCLNFTDEFDYYNGMISDEVYCASIDSLVSNVQILQSRGICQARMDSQSSLVAVLPELASGQASFAFAVQRQDDYLLRWTHEGNYRNLFTCNAQDSTAADEILCLHDDELRFDILAYTGYCLGTTEPFEGNTTSEIRILAPHGPEPKFAVRDGDRLFIYSFRNVPMPPGILPQDDPGGEDPPSEDPPQTQSSIVSVPDLCAFPNPFNAITTIRFELAVASPVVLDVYNSTGQKVRPLADRYYDQGIHEVRFDAAELSSGIYLAHLRADSHERTYKLVLLK